MYYGITRRSLEEGTNQCYLLHMCFCLIELFKYGKAARRVTVEAHLMYAFTPQMISSILGHSSV